MRLSNRYGARLGLAHRRSVILLPILVGCVVLGQDSEVTPRVSLSARENLCKATPTAPQCSGRDGNSTGRQAVDSNLEKFSEFFYNATQQIPDVGPKMTNPDKYHNTETITNRMCDVEERLDWPTHGFDNSGRSVQIFNPHRNQGIWISKCVQKDKPCSSNAKNTNSSFCKQNFAYVKLVKDPLSLGETAYVKIESGCVCMFKQD